MHLANGKGVRDEAGGCRQEPRDPVPVSCVEDLKQLEMTF